MKKIFAVIAAVSVCAALLAGCGSTASASTVSSSSETVSSSEAAAPSSEAVASSSEAASSSAADSTADTAALDAALSALEAVNSIANPRTIDDISLQYDMNVTADNLVAYKGVVTNNQDDCALIFVAQAKEGTVDTVKQELTAYRDSLAGNTLYSEFADKVAKAKDARIYNAGDYVAMVISGINGPDYSAIDTALQSAFAQ